MKMGQGLAVALTAAATLMAACSDELREVVLTEQPIGIDQATTFMSSAQGERRLRQGGLAVWGINTRGGLFVRGGDYRGAQFRVPHLFPGRFWFEAGTWTSDTAAVWSVDDLLTLMAVAPADFEASGFEAMGDYDDSRRFALTFTGELLPTGPLAVAQPAQKVYNEQSANVKLLLVDMLATMSFRIHNELDDDIDSLVAVGVSGRFPMGGQGGRPRVLLDEQLPQWECLETGWLDFGRHQATVFSSQGVERLGTVTTLADCPLYFFPGFAEDVKFEIVYTLCDSAGRQRREARLGGLKRLEQGREYLFDITIRQ